MSTPQHHVTEKLEMLRAMGWKPVHGAAVWISTESLSASSTLVQVILPDGRVAEARIDQETARVKMN